MEEKTGKKRKKLLIWILAILLIPIILAGILYLFLNQLVEVVAPPIAGHYGIAKFALKINELSWHDINVKDLQAGGPDGIKVGEIKFLRSKNAESPNEIFISNAQIKLRELNGKVFIPGVNLPAANPKLSSGEAKPIMALLKLPSALAELYSPEMVLSIKDSQLVFTSLSLQGEKQISLPFNLDFSMDKNGVFRLKLTGKISKMRNAPFLPGELTCKDVNILLEAKGILDDEKNCEMVSAKLAISFSDLVYKKNKQFMKIPKLELACKLDQEKDFFKGKFSAKFANGQYQAGDFRFTKIDASLPLGFILKEKLTLPKSIKEQNGMLKIGRIELSRRNLGNAELAFRQNGHEMKLNGSIMPLFLKKEAAESGIKLNGDLSIPLNKKEFSASCHAGIDFNNLKFDIGEVTPKVQNMIFEGDARIEAGVDLSKKKILTFAKLAIMNAKVEQKEKGLLVEGLNAGFEIPDLTRVRSSPAQKITFDSLKYGEIQFGKGNLQFQLESQKVLFLERSDIEWCDGDMDFGAIRINFDKPEDLDFTFYCDRIKVAEFLNQLKVAKASGGGRVAGRIPLKFINKKLTIKNGFLYSTPGEGGRIQLTDFAGSELADTSIQLAIAREALKDYNYKWIRLNFNTVQESLHIKLELDGAPSNRLPFTYDEKTVIKRSKSNDVKAKFQGISFDINFNIPIDDIIYYGQRTSNLFK